MEIRLILLRAGMPNPGIRTSGIVNLQSYLSYWSTESVEGDLGKTFMHLGIRAVVFVIISLIPGWIKKREQLEFPEKDSPAK
jgi:hypothetical protein